MPNTPLPPPDGPARVRSASYGRRAALSAARGAGVGAVAGLATAAVIANPCNGGLECIPRVLAEGAFLVIGVPLIVWFVLRRTGTPNSGAAAVLGSLLAAHGLRILHDTGASASAPFWGDAVVAAAAYALAAIVCVDSRYLLVKAAVVTAAVIVPMLVF